MTDTREIAYDITRRVNSEGGFLGLLLRYGLERSTLDARDRSLVTELTYGVQRHRNRLDYMISAFSRRPLRELDPEVLDVLRLGMYQIAETRIPQHAAVNEMVQLAKGRIGQGAASFVNAVMRRACDELQDLVWPSRDDLGQYLEIMYSHPRWLVDYLLRLLGPEQAIAVCASDNRIPSLCLRANPMRGDAQSLLYAIEDRGGGGELSTCLGEALVDVSLAYEDLLELLDRGYCVVQDESSMLVGHVVAPLPGETVIDACAAPGGKATHLAELGGETCRVIAVDCNERRLDAMRRTVESLGLRNIEVICGDSTRLAASISSQADAVLVDAPCSGLGTLQRNPELKWRRQEKDLSGLAELQLALLRGCAGNVRAGGVMVYSVCTFTREETVQVIEGFLAVEGGFHLEGQLQVWPQDHLEGMFIARFAKA